MNGTFPDSEPGRETSTRLVESAVSSFAERGYGPATLNEVAERLGITTGAIYANFRSKSDLFAAAIDHVSDRIERAVAEGQRPEYGLEARVCGFLDTIGALAVAEPETLRFNALVTVEVHRHPELRAALGDQFARRHDLCRRVIGLAADTGLGMSADDLARLMVVAADGLASFAELPAAQAPGSLGTQVELWKRLILGRMAA